MGDGGEVEESLSIDEKRVIMVCDAVVKHLKGWDGMGS